MTDRPDPHTDSAPQSDASDVEREGGAESAQSIEEVASREGERSSIEQTAEERERASDVEHGIGERSADIEGAAARAS